MPTIVVERELPCSADHAWELLKDAGDVHKAFPGLVRDLRLAADGVRTVTFYNGGGGQEVIVGIDVNRRRVVGWAAALAGMRPPSRLCRASKARGCCGISASSARRTRCLLGRRAQPS
jgi:hypothetical protein